ncbi:hypothetical protein [Vibrio mimicus]|uniref:Uncharacterized protein n=1 Tax=Vibrio mimicus TaxID=674 RepID=A0A2J9VJ53_VIBMI|nr:hypothetical protein [Vibrio mimicus]PNM63760.1 hypothetical protein AL544_001915 [Vibrio mimicus]PNM63826.1 hypothetical protein AL544_002390 [Vibrio mimicus]
MRRTLLVAFFLSIVQAYGSYLLHNDMMNIEILKWIISIVYIPLYLILLCVGGLLEVIFGWRVLKGGIVFPYLNDELWLVGILVLLPLNLLLLRLWGSFRQRT